MYLSFSQTRSIIFFIPFLLFFGVRNHFLKILLVLELIILYLLLFIRIFNIENDPLFFFILLSVRACEARIGLASLILLLRRRGNDFILSLERFQS